MNADGIRSLEKVDRGVVKDVVASLHHEERVELKKLGIGKEQLDRLCQFYMRIQAPDGVDKDRLRRLLAKASARGSFSKERFENLWQTLLPIGSADVSFMDLARWASKCLPSKSVTDEDELTQGKKQFAQASRPNVYRSRASPTKMNLPK